MDVTLGISMAPASVRMVLVEGENADGVTVEEDGFGVTGAASSAADQVVSAILGTRQGAAEGGYQLASTGVTWTNPSDAAALRDLLSARKVSNVMLVSAFLAAAALAQTVGNAVRYRHIALLYVEPETATLAVIDSDDGSVADVHRHALRSADLTAELTAMVAQVDALKTRPEGLFLVGSGVDVAAIKPALEAATRLPVSAPEEPETALARGAALASANAPLFASSTAALAYAQDPGTGAVNPLAVAPGYFEVAVDHTGVHRLAYSAVADEDAGEDADADTAVMPAVAGGGKARQRRRPLVLVGSAVAAIVAAAALATVVTLAIDIRQTVAFLPLPIQHLIVPALEAPAPAPPPAVHVAAPQPPAVHVPAPAAPAPVTVPAAPVPPVALPAPIPVAPVPAPVPAAPVPVPIPVPVRVPLPALQAPAPVLRPPVNLPVPQAPVQAPSPPLWLPTPPARVPSPPARVPTPPARVPTPPARVPAPPVQVPTPQPVRVPTPEPPAHLPTPAVPVQVPQPPVPVQLPQPPVRVPAPEPPVRMPTPLAPQPPAMPAPLMPRMPAPVMPAPAMPRMPAMPAPMLPRMPAPVMPAPAMPAPVLPHFSMPAPLMPHFSMPAPAMPHFSMPMPASRF